MVEIADLNLGQPPDPPRLETVPSAKSEAQAPVNKNPHPTHQTVRYSQENCFH